jgi:predicted nucleotidyltransferase
MTRARRPTARSLELARLAQTLAARLVRGDAQAVAITGSVARGTATAGSDLDLWVLGPPEGRRHLRARGVNVTLLTNTPREALALSRLAYWEVDDLQVLVDPRGHFARVQRRFDAHRAALRDDVLAATRDDLRRELALAGEGSSWKRLLFLRQAALRLAMVWLYLRTGWRVPRSRLVMAALPADARRRLQRVLALPGDVAARRALSQLRPVAARAQRWLAGRGVDAAWVVVPREIEARRAAGELDEAVLMARRFLTEALLPAVLTAGAGPIDVTALGAAPAGLRRLLFQLQGLGAVGAHDLAPVRRALREVAAMVQRLRLGPVLGPELRRALAALAR